jgi:hypothetical protein
MTTEYFQKRINKIRVNQELAVYIYGNLAAP